MKNLFYLSLVVLLLAFSSQVRAEEEETVDNDMAAHREGSRTDTETVDREAEAIKLDGLSVAEVKQLRDSAEKHAFQARQQDDEAHHQLSLQEQGGVPQGAY